MNELKANKLSSSDNSSALDLTIKAADSSSANAGNLNLMAGVTAGGPFVMGGSIFLSAGTGGSGPGNGNSIYLQTGVAGVNGWIISPNGDLNPISGSTNPNIGSSTQIPFLGLNGSVQIYNPSTNLYSPLAPFTIIDAGFNWYNGGRGSQLILGTGYYFPDQIMIQDAGVSNSYNGRMFIFDRRGELRLCANSNAGFTSANISWDSDGLGDIGVGRTYSSVVIQDITYHAAEAGTDFVTSITYVNDATAGNESITVSNPNSPPWTVTVHIHQGTTTAQNIFDLFKNPNTSIVGRANLGIGFYPVIPIITGTPSNNQVAVGVTAVTGAVNSAQLRPNNVFAKAGVGINLSSNALNTSALFQADSTSKGALLPRMTSAQKTAISTPATSLLVFDTDNDDFEFYDGVAWSQIGAKLSKFTVPYTSFSTAANTNTINLVTLPAKTVVLGAIVKHSTAFSGGTITDYTVQVADSGNIWQYTTLFDVFQAVSDAAYVSVQQQHPVGFTAGDTLKITATSTGDTLNHATAGSVDVWLLTRILL